MKADLGENNGRTMVFQNMCMRFGILFFCCMAFFATSYCDGNAHFSVTCHYFISPVFRDILRSDIEKLSQKEMPSNNFARLLSEELQKKYPFIDRIRVWYKGNVGKIISIDVQKPCAFVNNSFVLTNKGELVCEKYYRTHVCEECFLCTIDDCVLSVLHSHKDMAHNFADFVLNLPAEIKEAYDCYWHDPTLIYFKHVQMPIVLKADLDTHFDKALLQAIDCVQSYGELCGVRRHAKNTGNGGMNGRRTIDVRCKNKLILATQKGG